MSRLLAEPEAVEVSAAGGVPQRLRLGDHRHRVERVFARWRVESDWWRSPVSREYWKLQLGDELVCEVYEDRLSRGWWLSRIYD
ncbi:MAG TPA: hypothetical protein VG329_08965 [Candidatus Dormibacteraeota bacterium]|jgi:hypothetical protein|nr:hypothetical protein [Candidatus Dormibacteraeota bacterium]